MLFLDQMRLVILFQVKNAVENLSPFAWLAVIAQYDAVESHVSPIFSLAQIAKAIFHTTLPQLKFHRC